MICWCYFSKFRSRSNINNLTFVHKHPHRENCKKRKNKLANQTTQTNQQTIFLKPWPGGMRVSALNPPPPALAGEQCVLNWVCSFCQTAQIKITRTFCPIPNSTSFTSFSTPLKTPPSGPAHSAGPPKMGAPFSFLLPKCRTVVLFGRLFAHPKTHRKSDSRPAN